MTDYDDIEKGLMELTTDFLTANSISHGDLETENSTFDAAGKSEWFSCHYIPNDPEPVTAGNGGIDRLTSIFQIDFNVPVKTGLKRLRTLEKLARSFFYGGKTKTYGSAVVKITKAGFSRGRTVGNFYRRSLTITFYSDLIRSGA